MEDIFNGSKKLGFGLMRLPLLNQNEASSIDIELTKKMVDTFIEKGFTYFDTAWMYCGFKSENAAKEALVDRHNRDEYRLATKLHCLPVSISSFPLIAPQSLNNTSSLLNWGTVTL